MPPVLCSEECADLHADDHRRESSYATKEEADAYLRDRLNDIELLYMQPASKWRM